MKAAASLEVAEILRQLADRPLVLTPKTSVTADVATVWKAAIATIFAVAAATWWTQSTIMSIRTDATASVASVRAEMVSKQDFRELKAKVDKTNDGVNAINVSMAQVSARLEAVNATLNDIKTSGRTSKP
jgi:hypothetical protein